MYILESIGPDNVSAFKRTRLRALQESPLAFGSTYANESQITDAEWLKRALQWSSPGSIGYLALIASEPCGIAATFLDEQDARRAHLVSMWVDPSRRRSGVGRALIEAIRTWATKNGAESLRLTVTSCNFGTIEFYKRNGFAMTGNTEPYPNDPSLVEYEMVRALP
jgi:GNAT superfamily N-acetyltransferase